MTAPDNDHREAAYNRVCESYHAIDDFRTKLLGLLPVATGTGVFLLLSKNAELATKTDAEKQQAEPFFQAIGTFGAIFTLGLLMYELFGIKRCHYLIQAGERLEIELDVHGQFRGRPPALMKFINEPLASALIYPACMAAWTFVAVSFIQRGSYLPASVFIGGLLGVYIISLGISLGRCTQV